MTLNQLTQPTWFHDRLNLAQSQIEELALPSIQRAKILQDWFQSSDLDLSVVTSSQNIQALKDSYACLKLDQSGLKAQGQAIMAYTFQDLLSGNDIPEEVNQAFQKYFSQLIEPTADKITAHHYANLDHGLMLYFPANTSMETPLEVFTHIQSSMTHFHLLVVVGKNSHIKLLDHNTSEADLCLSSYYAEIQLEDGAILDYIALDRMTSQKNYIKRQVHTGRDAQMHWTLASFNEGHCVQDLQTHLIGEGSSANHDLIAISRGHQEQVIYSKIINQGSHTIGHIAQHGVALDHATLTMNGIGHILKQAKNADAQQENRLLMLSDHARGDANPILLIDEFEVSAGHAASVARVDESQLWYLMSRGISRAQAEYLVIRGFLMETITDVRSIAIRQQILEAVDNKLQGLNKEIKG